MARISDISRTSGDFRNGPKPDSCTAAINAGLRRGIAEFSPAVGADCRVSAHSHRSQPSCRVRVSPQILNAGSSEWPPTDRVATKLT
jgi:hypothetical protein